MKYKVGDKVKVRSDLEVGKFYGSQYLNERMLEFKTITIAEVRSYYYKVEENIWYYTDEMLDGLVEPKIEGYTLDELKDIIKEHEERNKPVKTKTIWDLKNGDEYYTITGFGGIDKLSWYYDDYGIERRDIGNCFLTKEEAEFELEAREVYTQLKKYSREFELKKGNWYLYYDFHENKINMAFSIRSKRNDLYFESEEVLQKAIKAVGEDRVLKYYLKVK